VIRIALIHDWLTGMRGGEAVLEAMAELFPKAEIFTLVSIPETLSAKLAQMKTHTSSLQNIPFGKEKYRFFLPLMPTLIEQFDLTGFDLILSSSHCVAKGVRKPPGSLHVSYVHAPMRYMWDRYEDYFGSRRASLPVRIAASLCRSYLKNWDHRVSQKNCVDLLLANSHFISAQMEKAYGRSSQTIYPFAQIERFSAPRQPSAGYLMVTAFAPYKRVDIAIEAFNRLKLPLWIVGSGQDEKQLKTMAGPTIRFLGSSSAEQTAQLYAQCRAFIFPGIEDFGITPLEAMAAGAPVIAFKAGGALETVTDQTGLFFDQQTPEALMEAVQILERQPLIFDEIACRQRAALFSKKRFQIELLQAIQQEAQDRKLPWANELPQHH
jgi:glycosyltransferase involved in cell wall biosynthesis